MIQSVSSVSSGLVPNILWLKKGAEKITVPIKPSQSLFAQFKHINTVPTQTDSAGVPVYKLRILDNLIERLSGGKIQTGDAVKISPDNIDKMITDLQKQVSMKESSFQPYFSGLKPETGLILDFFV